MDNFTSIPRDVLVSIVDEYLDGPLHLGRLGSTCKQLHSLLLPFLLVWKRRHMFRKQVIETEEDLLTLKNTFKEDLVEAYQLDTFFTEAQRNRRLKKDVALAYEVFADWLDDHKSHLVDLDFDKVCKQNLELTAIWHNLKARDSGQKKHRRMRFNLAQEIFDTYISIYYSVKIGDTVSTGYSDVSELVIDLLPCELTEPRTFDRWLLYRDNLLHHCTHVDHWTESATIIWLLEAGQEFDPHRLEELTELLGMLSSDDWNSPNVRAFKPEILQEAFTTMDGYTYNKDAMQVPSCYAGHIINFSITESTRSRSANVDVLSAMSSSTSDKGTNHYTKRMPTLCQSVPERTYTSS